MKRWLSIALCGLGLAGGLFPVFGTEEEDYARLLGLVKVRLPEFPRGLRSEGVFTGGGCVLLTHDAAGRVGDVLVLEATHPEFRAAIVAAVAEWQFAPARAGQPRWQRTPVVQFWLTNRGVLITAYSGRAMDYPGMQQAGAGVVRVRPFERLDRVPRALRQPMPEFPAALRSQAGEGWTRVEFLVDAEGRVRVPVVVAESAPAFGDAALAALADWRFEPPQEHGRPVLAMANWEFRFRPAAAGGAAAP